MRTKAVLVLFVILFGLTALATAQESLSGAVSEDTQQLKPMIPDPGVPDTIRVNDVSATAGGKAVVEVHVYNDEELGGMQMPLKWSSSAITLDSVSFVGSRISYVSTKPVQIDNVNQRVNIGAIVIFEAPVPPGQGLVAKLHFNIPGGTPDQVVTIDSTFYPPASTPLFSDYGGQTFDVGVRQGKLTIGNPQPSIGFSPSSFTFNATQDGANPGNQTLTISNTGAGNLNWTLTKASAWLGLSPMSGTNGGTVTVSANIAGLIAATYKDTIVITDVNASNNPQKVPVTLVVDPPPKPTISLSPTTFSFSATQGGGDPLSKILTITNTGAGTLNWAATKSSTWLGLSPTSGSGNASVTVSVTLGSLVAGTYVDTIVVTDPNATNSPQRAVVTLTVAPPPKPTILLSPTSFTFNATEGQGNPAIQTLVIANSGQGSLVWTATKSSAWLTLSKTSGTGNTLDSLSVDIAGLTAGTYVDTIVVSDPNATNNPQKASVTLIVAPGIPVISVNPTSLSFTGTQGGANPTSKTLDITNTGFGTLNWTLTKVSSWLGLAPSSGSGNATITVSINLTGVVAGTYSDTIVVADPGASNSPVKVPVTLTVAPPPKPTILLSPTSFTFNATQGGANPAIKTLTITNSGEGTLVWTATKSSAWLTLSRYAGVGDRIDTLSVDITGLTAGTYVDTIVVSDPNATNNPQTALVTLVIAAAPKPVIALAPSSFTFNAIIDSIIPPPQTLTITNAGAGTLNWTVSKIAAWLTLAPMSGSGDGSVTVSVDITGLVEGIYKDTIVVTDPEATNSPQRVPVVLFVYEPMKPSIFLSPLLFTFNAVEGAGLLDTQVLHISSIETGILNWTATNIDPWLNLYPSSGVGDGLVTLIVDATGLTAGTYVDTIRVSDPNALNSPQQATVILVVSAAPQPIISVTPGLLEFTAMEGGSNPSPKTFTISNAGTGELHWNLGVQEDWLIPTPMFGTGNATVTVNINIAGLTEGIYFDTIFVYDPNATNSPQYVAIGLAITPAGGERDSVTVSHVTSYPGGKTVVDITYQNFADIGGFTLPLYFVGAGVTCDSVSWVGSRFDYMDRFVTINNDEWTVLVGAVAISAPDLAPGSGLLARLYFSIDPAATPKVVPIDTGFVPPAGEFYFADAVGGFRPTGFAAGSITITEETLPCFSFPVDTINFYGTIGESIPSIILPVTNPCGGTLTWTATWDSTWLAVTPSSGSQNQMVKFQVDTDSLGVGSYLEIVKFESNGTNSPFYLKVRLFISYLEHPRLAVSDSLFDFGDVCRGDSVVGGFDIFNAGDGTLPWTANVSEPLYLSAHSGVAPSHVTFFLPTGLLPTGLQELPIIITSAADPESPQTVWVKLNVIDCGGECGFDIADVSGGIGLPVSVPIYAFNIRDVAGLEFHIWYDTTVLQADSVTSNFMAGPDISFADPMIHYVWDSLDGAFDVPDGAAIMTLWFTVVGEVGQTGSIEWMGNSEVVNPLAQVLNVTYCPGSVFVVPPVHLVYGRVVYYDLTKPVPDVTVEIQGPGQAVAFTDGLGRYRFEDLFAGDYQVYAYRFNDDSGVTVADAVKMRRHLAYIEPFDSPYKMVAADVNVSNTVSIADVIVVRRYLAMLDTLPSGNWIFVDSGFALTMDNWFVAPRDIRVTITDHDVTLEPFVGVRMGDVNNTWGSPKRYAKPAAGDYVSVGIGDVTALEGETVAVPVTLANASDMAGLEVHVGYDRNVLTYTGLSSEVLPNMTTNGYNGAVHMIWEDINAPKQLNGEQTVITLNFRVTGALPASTEISVTGAEVVNSIGDPYRLAVTNGRLYNGNGGSSSLPNTYSLAQNSPNPFNPTTTIRASMADDGEFTLTIFNIMGEKVRQYRGWHAAGPLETIWDARNDNGSQVPTGIYLYRFQAGSFSQTKQMILLK